MSSDFGDYEFVAGMNDDGERILSKAIISDGTEVSAIMVQNSALQDGTRDYEIINIEGAKRIIIAIDQDFITNIIENAPNKATGAYGVGVFVGQVVTDVARDVVAGINSRNNGFGGMLFSEDDDA